MRTTAAAVQQQQQRWLVGAAAVLLVLCAGVVRAQVCFEALNATTSITDDLYSSYVENVTVVLRYTYSTEAGAQWPVVYQHVHYKPELYDACVTALSWMNSTDLLTPVGQLLDSTDIRQFVNNTIVISHGLKCVPSMPDICGVGELSMGLEARYSHVTSGGAAPDHTMNYRAASLFSVFGERTHVVSVAGQQLPVCFASFELFNQTGAINDNSDTGGMLLWLNPTDDTYDTVFAYQHLQHPGTGVVSTPWDWNSTCKEWGGSVVMIDFEAVMKNGTRVMTPPMRPHFHCYPVSCSSFAIQAELRAHAQHLMQSGDFLSFVGHASAPLLSGLNFSYSVNAQRNDSCSMRLFAWQHDSGGVNSPAVFAQHQQPASAWPAQRSELFGVTVWNSSALWSDLNGWERMCFTAGGVPALRGHFDLSSTFNLTTGLELCVPDNCDQASLESYLQEMTDEFVATRQASFGAEFVFPHRDYWREMHVSAFASGGEDCLDRLITMHWTNTSVNSDYGQPHTLSTLSVPADRPLFVNVTWQLTNPDAYTAQCAALGGQPIDEGGVSYNFSGVVTAFHGRKLCIPNVCRMDPRLQTQVQDYFRILAVDAVSHFSALYEQLQAEGPAPFTFMVDSGAHDRDTTCVRMHELYELRSGAGPDFKYYVNDDAQRGSFQSVSTQSFNMNSVALSLVSWTDFNTWATNCANMMGKPTSYSYVAMSDTQRLVSGTLGQFSCVPQFCEHENVNYLALRMLDNHVFNNQSLVYGEAHLGDSDVSAYNFSHNACLQRMMSWTFTGPNSAQYMLKYRGSEPTCAAPVGGVTMCHYTWSDFNTWSHLCTDGAGSVVPVSVLLSETSGSAAMNISADFNCKPNVCAGDDEQVYMYVKMRAMEHMRRNHKYGRVSVLYQSLNVTVPDARCGQQFALFEQGINSEGARAAYFSPPVYHEMPIGPRFSPSSSAPPARPALMMSYATVLQPHAQTQYAEDCAKAGGILTDAYDTKVWGVGNFSRWTSRDKFCVPAVCFSDDLKEGVGRSVWRALHADPALVMVKRAVGDAYQALGQDALTCARQFNLFTTTSMNVDFLGKYHARHMERSTCVQMSAGSEACFDEFLPAGRRMFEADCSAQYGITLTSSVTLTLRNEAGIERNMVWPGVPLCVPSSCYFNSASDGSVQTAVQKFAEQFAAWFDVSAVSVTVEGGAYFAEQTLTVDFDRAHEFSRNPACLFLMTSMGERLGARFAGGTNSEEVKSQLSVLNCNQSSSQVRTCTRTWSSMAMLEELCNSDTDRKGTLLNFEHRHRWVDGSEVRVLNDFMCVPTNCTFAAATTQTLTDYLQFMADQHVSAGNFEGHVAEEVDLMLWAPGMASIAVHSSCHDFGTCPTPGGASSKSKAWIAGAVIGGLAGAGLLGWLLYFVITHRKYGSMSSGDVDLKSAKMIKPQI